MHSMKTEVADGHPITEIGPMNTDGQLFPVFYSTQEEIAASITAIKTNTNTKKQPIAVRLVPI